MVGSKAQDVRLFRAARMAGEAFGHTSGDEGLSVRHIHLGWVAPGLILILACLAIAAYLAT